MIEKQTLQPTAITCPGLQLTVFPGSCVLWNGYVNLRAARLLCTWVTHNALFYSVLHQDLTKRQSDSFIDTKKVQEFIKQSVNNLTNEQNQYRWTGVNSPSPGTIWQVHLRASSKYLWAFFHFPVTKLSLCFHSCVMQQLHNYYEHHSKLLKETITSVFGKYVTIYRKNIYSFI